MTVQEEDPDETGRDSKHTQWCHCDSDVTLLLLHTQSIQVILSTPRSDDITYVTSLFCISDTGSDFIAFPCNKLWYTYKIKIKKRENSFREISSYNLRTCGNAMACLPDWPVSYLSVLQKRKKRPSQHLETPWFGVLLPPSVETWIVGWPICESEAHALRTHHKMSDCSSVSRRLLHARLCWLMSQSWDNPVCPTLSVCYKAPALNWTRTLTCFLRAVKVLVCVKFG